MGHIPQQALGQYAGQRGYVHLDKVWEVAVEHLLKGIADRGVIAPDREDAPAAQEVEVSLAVPVFEVLPACPLVCLVEADGPEHPDHLLVEGAHAGYSAPTHAQRKGPRSRGSFSAPGPVTRSFASRTREFQGLSPGAIEMPQAKLTLYAVVPRPGSENRPKQGYRYKYGRAAADT